MKRIAIITVLSPLLIMPVDALAQDLPVKPNAGNMNLVAQTINWGGVAVAVLLVIAAWLTLKFIDNLVDELGSSFAEQRLLLQRANAFFRFFVYIATVSGVVLLSFDLSEQFLTVLGGGIVVAIGFGTRDLLASLVAGVMIIFDRPFQVGDRVRFAGEYGDIVQIGLR